MFQDDHGKFFFSIQQASFLFANGRHCVLRLLPHRQGERVPVEVRGDLAQERVLERREVLRAVIDDLERGLEVAVDQVVGLEVVGVLPERVDHHLGGGTTYMTSKQGTPWP